MALMIFVRNCDSTTTGEDAIIIKRRRKRLEVGVTAQERKEPVCMHLYEFLRFTGRI